MTDNQTQRPLEDLLREVIEAQVRGGYRNWEFVLNTHDHETGDILHSGNFYSRMREMALGTEGRFHILEILLDTEGCKAAYPGWRCDDCDGECPDEYCPFHEPLYECVMHAVVNACNSGSGNNVRAALETAVSFLPKA